MKTAAELYRSRKADRQVVDVVPPSGIVFKFHKPRIFSFVMTHGLPLGLAAQMYRDKGAGEGTVTAEQEKLFEILMRLRDQVIELSVEPKLTLGDPAPGELSVEEIDDEDLAYFVNWVANGGDVSAATNDALGTFRPGSGPTSVAGADGKRHRAKAKQAP